MSKKYEFKKKRGEKTATYSANIERQICPIHLDVDIFVYVLSSSDFMAKKITKTDFVDKPTKTDSVDKSTKTDSVDKPTKTDSVDKPTKTDFVDKPTKTDSVDKPTKTDSVDKPTKTDSVDKPTKTETKVLEQPIKQLPPPAISIVIPLYNSAKYIGECLDSLLTQTFQNFEVIVVDDCSTDSSVELVRSYVSQFGGRLKLAKTKKNSGTPGEPGNIGVALSRGEYLFIMDDDDTITPDALEKLYNAAKEFKADVVTCEKYYNIPEEHWSDKEYRNNIAPFSYQEGGFVDKPTLIPFNVANRVQDFFQRRFLWSPWTKLIRRDYLIENQIHFQDTLIQDMLATCCLVCTAKKFVRVPYVINYYRMRKDSFYIQEREPLEQMKTYMRSLKVGFKYLNTFLNDIEFFQQNPEVKYAALKVYFFENWNMYLSKVYKQVPAHEREEVLRKEFGGDDNTLLTMFLFDVLFEAEKENAELKTQQIPKNFAPFITARIDIKMMTEGDFQILSMSDAKASVQKPAWLQKDGIGYQIQSYAGQLYFTAKATVDGKIFLNLLGLDIHIPEKNFKRIPFWIDYTKLIVNEKTVFNKIIPAWHDKPYRYDFDIKAGEEVKIQLEWQPHRSDT